MFGKLAAGTTLAVALTTAVPTATAITVDHDTSRTQSHDSFNDNALARSQGTEIIAALVFGVGAATGPISERSGDKDYQEFVEFVASQGGTAHEAFMIIDAFSLENPALLSDVEEAATASDPIKLEAALTNYTTSLSAWLVEMAGKDVQSTVVDEEFAHTTAVVPLAVAVAAYLYVAAAHSAAVAVNAAVALNVAVYRYVRFWPKNGSVDNTMARQRLILAASNI